MQKPLSGTFKWHRRSKPEMKAVWSVVQDLFPDYIGEKLTAIPKVEGVTAASAPADSPAHEPSTPATEEAPKFALRPLHLLQIVRGGARVG